MENETKSMRLNKYLSGTGLCSRREADKLIEEGHVTVEGPDGEVKTATLGSRVGENDKVYVDGKPVRDKGEEKLYMVINKPKGVICTGDRRVKENIIDFAGLNHYISYAGRLDRESTGLVLLTNDGDLNDKIMRAAGFHEKEYIVKVDRYITDDFLQKMSRGVSIVLDDDRHLVKDGEDGSKGTRVMTRPCTIERRGARKFSIILTQGYNRQIRRMCQALGYTAVEIKRVRIMNLRLGGLREGMKRFLTREEIEGLKQLADAPGPEPVARVITNTDKAYPPRPEGERSPRYENRDNRGSERIYGDRPYRDSQSGERRYGNRPQRDSQDGEKRYSERPRRDSQSGDRSYSDRPRRDSHDGERRYGERPQRDSQTGDRSHGERTRRDSQGGERRYSDRPRRDSQSGERSYGDRPRQGSSAGYGSREAGKNYERRGRDGEGVASAYRNNRRDGRSSQDKPYPDRREKRNHDRNDT